MFLTIWWKRAGLLLMLTTILDGGTKYQLVILGVRILFPFIIETRAFIPTGGFRSEPSTPLDERENKSKREFLIYTAEYNITTMNISFQRRQATRNTGLRVSWYYSSPQIITADPKFVEDNKLFILIANVVHKEGVTAELKRHIREIIRECFKLKSLEKY